MQNNGRVSKVHYTFWNIQLPKCETDLNGSQLDLLMFVPSSPVKNLLKQFAPDETRENKVAVVSARRRKIRLVR